VTLALDAPTPGEAAYDAAALGVDVGSIEQEAAPVQAGAPMARESEDDDERTVLIELTSKRIKRWLAAAAGVLMLALVLAAAGMVLVFRRQQFAGWGMVLLWASGVLLVLGMALMVVSRVRAWWRHG
jgi:hypothetical protein